MRGEASTAPIDRIRGHLVGLRMPRALETLDHVMQQLERGQLSAIEAVEVLLAEEITVRESRPAARLIAALASAPEPYSIAIVRLLLGHRRPYIRDRHTANAMMAIGISTSHAALSIFTGWDCPLGPACRSAAPRGRCRCW